jgi:predicted DNA-binding transcriptional regulator YafY
MESLLVQAIRERRVVTFAYGGEHRAVEPCRLGLQAGRLRLTGWQRRKGWRSFHLDGIADLALTDHHFDEPREGYARGDPTLDRILAEI